MRHNVTLYVHCLSYTLLHKTKTARGSRTASYSLCTDGSFPGNKRAGVWMQPLTSITEMLRIGAPDVCSRHLPSWGPREDFTFDCRVQLKCDGTRWRKVMGKLAKGVGTQYSSHYHGTWYIQHYYSWCAHLGCQQSTELTPPPIYMGSSVSPKDEICFLRVCHHISNAVYH
jgi:hypothetical protein